MCQPLWLGWNSVLVEDSDEETEAENTQTLPIVKSVSETAPVELLSQAVKAQGKMQQTLL